MELFTIGDSISQGFMSAGAAKPQLSYSTLLAKALGDDPYEYLTWDERHHLKVDLELIFRTLQGKYGTNIRGLEWLGILPTVSRILDEAESYYEEGGGTLGRPVDGGREYFHSVAVEGMDVADSWSVTPNECRNVIQASTKKKIWRDGFLSPASNSFYRNAYRVLNPGGAATEGKYGDYSALKWLDHHAQGEGIRRVVLWLGANNALGTLLRLKVNQTPGDGTILQRPRAERMLYNLWHPNDFQAEYTKLLSLVDGSMRANLDPNWNVFVGTIPYVTIAPFAKGMGEHRYVDDHDGLKGLYYQYYSYFPLQLESAIGSGAYLTFRDALYIDRVILEYNRMIKKQLAELNARHGTERYHVVDMGEVLSKLAWKRNRGQPTYQLPNELRFAYPSVDTKYYDVRPDGVVEGGGIFSLDGIHPTATAHGIIAWEFMKVMKAAGAMPEAAKLDWNAILKTDRLRTEPLPLIREIYQHDGLLRLVVMAIQLLRE